MVYMKLRSPGMGTARYVKCCGSNAKVISSASYLFSHTLQFRALSDQMYKSPEYHKYVRKEVVRQV